MMMRRCVKIALAAGIATGPPASAQPLHMSDAEVTATFSGGAFDGVYADNSPWKETYNSDGSIIYSDRFGPRKGEWSVRGTGDFCTYYTDGSGACWRVERVSENCFRFYIAIGDPATKRAASATGWATASPSTCGPGKPVS
jgi:hypothetical protein